jgi:SAM-dependent methyltransferase
MSVRSRRLWKYDSICSPSWTVGRYLLPAISRIGTQCDGTVLDIGCGESPFRSLFPTAQRYLRVDVNAENKPDMIAALPRLPLKQGCADLILLSQVLGDLPDLSESFAELCSLLKPQGLLVIHETMGYPEHDLPYDFFRVMPQAIRHFASDQRMKELELVFCGGLFARIAILVNNFLFGRIPVFGSFLIAITNSLALLGDSVIDRSHLADSYVITLQKEAEL